MNGNKFNANTVVAFKLAGALLLHVVAPVPAQGRAPEFLLI
jgi:hypothetical protein